MRFIIFQLRLDHHSWLLLLSFFVDRDAWAATLIDAFDHICARIHKYTLLACTSRTWANVISPNRLFCWQFLQYVVRVLHGGIASVFLSRYGWKLHLGSGNFGGLIFCGGKVESIGIQEMLDLIIFSVHDLLAYQLLWKRTLSSWILQPYANKWPRTRITVLLDEHLWFSLVILRLQALSCQQKVICVLLRDSSAVTLCVHKLAKTGNFPRFIVTQLRILVQHVRDRGLALIVLFFRLVFKRLFSFHQLHRL